MIRILQPITPNAQTFCAAYGTKFVVESVGQVGLVVHLRTMVNQKLVVERKSDGIYINHVLFCAYW